MDKGVATEEIREVIQDILQKLLTSYAPQKVILFGSYAYGTPQPGSDIDLLIIKETPERFIDRWVTVRRILSDPKRTVSLETIVLTPQEVAKRLAVGDQFLKEIMEKGEVLYAA
jgi:predicted nucleotidyltransferase